MTGIFDDPGYVDHVEWVDGVAHKLMESFEAMFRRKPTIREIEVLLGSFLMTMVRVQEGEDVSGT